MEKDHLISENTPILNGRFIIVETITSFLSPMSTQTSTPTTTSLTDQYLIKNFSELIYNTITKDIHEVLKGNQIIKMPILYHSNIYFIQQPIESVVSTSLLSKNPTYQLTVQYDSATTTSITTRTHPLITFTFSSNEINRPSCSKEMISANKIVTPKLATYMYEKTAQIVETLNRHLSPHNIFIQKADLGFSYILGSKNIPIFDTMTPELIMEHIVLNPIINVFDHFTFVDTSSTHHQQITDPIVIYKAFANKPTVEIQAYQTANEVIHKFKQHYQL
jgi:hypothetical protein